MERFEQWNGIPDLGCEMTILAAVWKVRMGQSGKEGDLLTCWVKVERKAIAEVQAWDDYGLNVGFCFLFNTD